MFGVSRRTTFNKQKRACAYDFPLDVFNRSGRPTDSTRTELSPVMPDTAEEDSDEQQRLDAVAEQDPDSGEETKPESDSHPVDGKQESDRRSEKNADGDLHTRL